MKKISFTLQDAPDFWQCFEADFHPAKEGDYSVADEQAIAKLIYEEFPNLKKCHRRVKNLRIVDENGQCDESIDFDIPMSIYMMEE